MIYGGAGYENTAIRINDLVLASPIDLPSESEIVQVLGYVKAIDDQEPPKPDTISVQALAVVVRAQNGTGVVFTTHRPDNQTWTCNPPTSPVVAVGVLQV